MPRGARGKGNTEGDGAVQVFIAGAEAKGWPARPCASGGISQQVRNKKRNSRRCRKERGGLGWPPTPCMAIAGRRLRTGGSQFHRNGPGGCKERRETQWHRFRGRVLRVGRVWGHPGAPAWTYVGVIRHRKVKEAAGIPAELQGGRTEGATIKIHGEMVLLWGRLVTQAP